MKVVDLIGRDSLSLEQSESYVGKGALLCCSGGPVLALHYSIIRGWAAERDPVPFVIRADAGEGAASGHLSFEMVNVGWFQVRSRGLIVAAIFIQPWNGIRIAAAVCGGGLLVSENPGRRDQRNGGQNTGLQHGSAGADWARLVDVGHRDVLRDKIVSRHDSPRQGTVSLARAICVKPSLLALPATINF
jgi:hypothetical protein